VRMSEGQEPSVRGDSNLVTSQSQFCRERFLTWPRSTGLCLGEKRNSTRFDGEQPLSSPEHRRLLPVLSGRVEDWARYSEGSA